MTEQLPQDICRGGCSDNSLKTGDPAIVLFVIGMLQMWLRQFYHHHHVAH
jgi:hypothetical protein